MLEDDNKETTLENADLDIDLEDVDLDSLNLDDNDDGSKDAKIEEETAAAATIKAKPSRTATLASIVQHAAGLSDEDLNGFAKSIAKPGNPIPEGNAAKNKATIAMKTVTKEELEGLFGDDLSEDFREQTTVLFESAVNARVATEIASISEELEAKYEATTAALEEAYAVTLEEEVNALSDTMYEQVDSYLTHVAESWTEANEVAINKSLRAEIAEDFMDKMKDLFLEHNLNIPDESEDVLGEMLEVNEDLEAKVNELTEEVIALKAGKLDEGKANALAESTTGLAATTVDRIRTLAEGIEATDIETYNKKLNTIVESISKKPVTSTGILVEEAPAVTEAELNEENKPKAPVLDARMAAYLEAAKRA